MGAERGRSGAGSSRRFRPSRLPAVLAILAILVGALTACTFSRSESVEGRSASVAAGRATTLRVPSGPIVSLPEGSIKGSGTVKVAAARQGAFTGWTIKLDGGASLVGRAALSFPIVRKKGEPSPLVGYNERLGDQIRLVRGEVVGNRYFVKSDHFSNWFTGLLDVVKDEFVAEMSKTFAGFLPADAPICSGWPDLQAAGYRSSSTRTRLISSCFGADAGAPQVKISNRLNSPQVVETMPGLGVRQAATSLDDQFPKLISELQAVRRKGDTVHFLAAKDIMVLDAAKNSSTALNVSPSGAGYLASVLVLAGKLVAQLDGFAGVTRSAQDVQLALQGEDCMGGVIEQAVGKKVTTGHELAVFAAGLVKPVMACAASYMREGTKGYLIGEVAGWVEWLAGAAQAADAGAIGALASILEPDGATIAITAPAASSSSAGTDWLWTVPSLSAQQSGDRVDDTTGSTAFATAASDATEQWVGCAGAVATTTYPLNGAWAALHWAFGVQGHAPKGMSVRVRLRLDGKVVADRVLVKGAPDEVLSTVDVAGVRRLEVEAQTSDACSAASTGYGAFLDTYLMK